MARGAKNAKRYRQGIKRYDDDDCLVPNANNSSLLLVPQPSVGRSVGDDTPGWSGIIPVSYVRSNRISKPKQSGREHTVGKGFDDDA